MAIGNDWSVRYEYRDPSVEDYKKAARYLRKIMGEIDLDLMQDLFFNIFENYPEALTKAYEEEVEKEE